MAEQAIVDRITRYLGRRGAWSMKTHGGAVGRRGIADLLCCYRGRFLAIEVKTDRGRATLIQQHELARVHQAGGRAFIAHNTTDVELALDAIDRELDPPLAA